MIGPGWLPRPGRAWRKRTLAYTPVRRRPRRRAVSHNRAATASAPVHHDPVIFDHGPCELPVATVRPRETRAHAVAIAVDLGRWAVAPWHWLRPRTVPVVVAVIGMLCMFAAANYLAYHADQPPATYSVPVHIDRLR